MPTVTRSGMTLYFEDRGAGHPVLFHTGGGGDHRMWELAGYTSLLAGYRHLLLDHRGHGRSGCPAGVEAHRVEEYAADVVAVLDAAEVEQAVLLGYSGGATVAYHVAARHPERCRALVGIGSLPEPGSDPGPNLETAAHLRQVGMRALMEEMAAEEDEAAPQWLIDNLATTDTEMFALLLEGWAAAPSLWALFPAIAAPTLLVVGQHEQEPGDAERAARRLVQGQSVVLPGYGHLQAFWHGEVTGPVIADFLDGLPAPASAGS